MTVSTDIRKNTFPGDGTTAVRNTTFVLFTTSELIIYEVDSLGVETQLLEGTDYTVTLGATLPSVAAITPLAAIAIGDSWVAYRESAQTQELDYVNADDFPAQAHEEGLDRDVMRSQESADFHRRALAASVLDSDAELPLTIPRKADRASKVLGFDASGNPIVFDTTLFDASGYSITAAGIAMIQAANAAAQLALLAGVHNRTGVVDELDAGTLGARPAAATFGQGFYYATDTFELYYSSGSAWTLVGVDQQLYASVAVTAGRLSIATDRKQLYRGNGATRDLIRSYSPRYLQGFKLTKATANTLTVGVGTCRNMLPAANDDEVNIRLASAMTKDIRTTWAAGSGNGGMVAASHPAAANTFFYVFALAKSDGTVDIAFDPSVTGAAIAADATIAAAGFTHFRRVGQVKTTRGDAAPNAVILDFVFENGWYQWTNLYNAGGANAELDQAAAANGLEYSTTGAIDHAAGVDVTLPRTPAFPVLARIAVHSGSALMFSTGGHAVATPVNFGTVQWPLSVVANGTTDVNMLDIMTDSSKQIRVRDSAAGNDTIRIALLGYYDFRDKE